jgi:hypothetical protein
MESNLVPELKQKIHVLETELERLRHLLFLMKRDKFGSTSEKFTELQPEQLLFNEIEKEAKTAEPEQTELIEGNVGSKRAEVQKSHFRQIYQGKRLLSICLNLKRSARRTGQL